jgi:phospholipid/cholesterol/gamma-HCH transport system substrate-binding protein/paraquat-inducible protein B
MEEGKRYGRLGVFVAVTVAIAAAVLFLLGGRNLFKPTLTFETYFTESVAGLEIGAPVRFRGVPLGQVTEIVTSSSSYEGDIPLEKRKALIVVRANVNYAPKETEQLKRDVPLLVQKGLRVQTQLAGITGQQYLSLDYFDPQEYPPLEVPWTPKHIYVPSAPSLSGEIIGKAQRFLASLDEADVKALGQNLNALVLDVKKKVGELPVADLSAKADAVLADADAAVKRIDKILATAPIDHTLRKIDSASTRLDAILADPGIKQTVDNTAAFSGRLRKVGDDGELERMVKRIGDAAERIDALVGDNQYDVRVAVQDLRVTADNLRALSEAVKRYPAGALVGGPPDKLQFPRKSQ